MRIATTTYFEGSNVEGVVPGLCFRPGQTLVTAQEAFTQAFAQLYYGAYLARSGFCNMLVSDAEAGRVRVVYGVNQFHPLSVFVSEAYDECVRSQARPGSPEMERRLRIFLLRAAWFDLSKEQLANALQLDREDLLYIVGVSVDEVTSDSTLFD